MNNDAGTYIHYLAGTDALCGVTRGFIKMNDHLISIFAKDINCIACTDKISELAKMGFVPKH